MSSDQHTIPLVSVIIPFLNEEVLLSEAIDSIINQKYTKWEIILIDDGSWDGSTNIAKGYASRYPGKIIYIDHEQHSNKGLSASRNAGIAAGGGQLVAFLDADDVWLPEKLQKQVAIFQQNPEIAMIIQASDYWYNWNGSEKPNIRISVGVQQDKIYSPPQLSVKLYPLGKGAAPCPTSIMIKKTVLEKHGGFEEIFRGKYQAYEDQPFLAKIYLNEKVYVSSNSDNLYRIRHGSLSQVTAAQGNYNQVRHYFLKWLEDYLSDKKINYTTIQLLVRKAFLQYKFPEVVKWYWIMRSKYHQLKKLTGKKK